MHESNETRTYFVSVCQGLPLLAGHFYPFYLVSFRPLGLVARNEFKVRLADLEAYLLEKLAGADSDILEARTARRNIRQRPRRAEWADVGHAMCVSAARARKLMLCEKGGEPN